MALADDLVGSGEVDADEVDARAAAGGLAPEGIHEAVLNGAGSVFISGIKRADELVFLITAGPGAGHEVKEPVWMPKGEEEKKDQFTKDRQFRFAHALGLLKKDRKNGKNVFSKIDGKSDFCDCLGTLCFIEVRHEEEEYEKDGKKRKIMKAKLTVMPAIFHHADSQCAKIKKATADQIAALRAGSTVGGAGAGAGASGSAAKKDDFSDL